MTCRPGLTSPRLRGVLLLGALLATLASARAASAQNPRDIPLGGRTAMMGGAGTAAGDDGAMPYLNPAGLAQLPRDVFSLSASVYGWSGRTIDPYLHPDGLPEAGAQVIEERFDGTSLVQLPSSVMYALPLSAPDAEVRHAIAVSIVIPAAERSRYDAHYLARVPAPGSSRSEDRQQSYEATDYYAGLSYALAYSDWLRVGASLYGVYSRWSEAIGQAELAISRSGSSLRQSEYRFASDGEAFALVPVLGAQASAGHWSFGVALAPPGIALGGQLGTTLDFTRTVESGDTVRVHRLQSTATYEQSTPLRLNAGVAFAIPKVVSVAADVVWFAPQTALHRADGVTQSTIVRSNDVPRDFRRATPLAIDSLSVVDVSVGIELWLTDSVALRAGGFSNLSNLDTPQRTSEDVYAEVIDRAGASLGLGLLSGSFDTTVGAVYQHGWGVYISPTADGQDVASVPIAEHTVMLVLSGAVTLGDLF